MVAGTSLVLWRDFLWNNLRKMLEMSLDGLTENVEKIILMQIAQAGNG